MLDADVKAEGIATASVETEVVELLNCEIIGFPPQLRRIGEDNLITS